MGFYVGSRQAIWSPRFNIAPQAQLEAAGFIADLTEIINKDFSLPYMDKKGAKNSEMWKCIAHGGYLLQKEWFFKVKLRVS